MHRQHIFDQLRVESVAAAAMSQWKPAVSLCIERLDAVSWIDLSEPYPRE
jgi:hypothetical protein